jgi:hypothetical protein
MPWTAAAFSPPEAGPGEMPTLAGLNIGEGAKDGAAEIVPGATVVGGAGLATGDNGAGLATGDNGAGLATGDNGAGLATGDNGAGLATGDNGAGPGPGLATGDNGAEPGAVGAGDVGFGPCGAMGGGAAGGLAAVPNEVAITRPAPGPPAVTADALGPGLAAETSPLPLVPPDPVLTPGNEPPPPVPACPLKPGLATGTIPSVPKVPPPGAGLTPCEVLPAPVPATDAPWLPSIPCTVDSRSFVSRDRKSWLISMPFALANWRNDWSAVSWSRIR